MAAIQVQKSPGRLCQTLHRVVQAAGVSQAEKQQAGDDSSPGGASQRKRRRLEGAPLILAEEGQPIVTLHAFAALVLGTNKQPLVRPSVSPDHTSDTIAHKATLRRYSLQHRSQALALN